MGNEIPIALILLVEDTGDFGGQNRLKKSPTGQRANVSSHPNLSRPTMAAPRFCEEFALNACVFCDGADFSS
jgi:hypothetical protein